MVHLGKIRRAAAHCPRWNERLLMSPRFRVVDCGLCCVGCHRDSSQSNTCVDEPEQSSVIVTMLGSLVGGWVERYYIKMCALNALVSESLSGPERQLCMATVCVSLYFSYLQFPETYTLLRFM